MTRVLQPQRSRDTIGGSTAPTSQPDMILISRADLEKEHRQLLSRVQWIRQMLGYPELQTGHKRRNSA